MQKRDRDRCDRQPLTTAGLSLCHAQPRTSVPRFAHRFADNRSDPGQYVDHLQSYGGETFKIRASARENAVTRLLPCAREAAAGTSAIDKMINGIDVLIKGQDVLERARKVLVDTVLPERAGCYWNRKYVDKASGITETTQERWQGNNGLCLTFRLVHRYVALPAHVRAAATHTRAPSHPRPFPFVRAGPASASSSTRTPWTMAAAGACSPRSASRRRTCGWSTCSST